MFYIIFLKKEFSTVTVTIYLSRANLDGCDFVVRVVKKLMSPHSKEKVSVKSANSTQ